MSRKRIRVRPVAAKISFIDISLSKRQRRKTCSLDDTVVLNADEVLQPPPIHTHDWDHADDINSSTIEEVKPANDIESFVGVTVSSYLDTASQRNYAQRQERACEAWAQIREQMRTAYVESSVPIIGHTCAVCNQPATIVCQQCGPQVVLCVECAEAQHLSLNIFHRPRLWQVCKLF